MKKKVQCYSYIRFSTLDQLRGDSLRRQVERTKEYADKNGLELNDSLTIKDIGVSGFRGKNREKGKLAIFLSAIENGLVKDGSVLIIESFDRLSRDKVLASFGLFTQILGAGIKIVTLLDGREYTYESVNNDAGQLYASLGSMLLANEESEKKSYRLKNAWDKKRNNLDKKKLTSISPAWLKYEKSSDMFHEIEERCEMVQKMFDWSEEGLGVRLIAIRLNEKKIPSWRKKTGWYASYIRKILTNRSVIGEFQPHTKTEGVRHPLGDPIIDYYPSIVGEDQFRRVQEKLKERTTKGVGRVGEIQNLFTGLVKCDYCGGSMVLVNKGRLPKGGTYLACNTARMGLGCEYHSIRYPEFEEAFLYNCQHLDISEILSVNSKSQSELSSISDRLTENRNKLDEFENKKKNLIRCIEDEDDIEAQRDIRVRLKIVRGIIGETTKEVNILETRYRNLSTSGVSITENVEALSELYEKLSSSTDDDRKYLRLKLRSKIQSLVEKIRVFPAGRIITKEKLRSNLEKNRDNKISDSEFEQEWFEYRSFSLEAKKGRCEFYICFKGGNLIRVVESDQKGVYEKHYDRDGEKFTIKSNGFFSEGQLQ